MSKYSRIILLTILGIAMIIISLVAILAFMFSGVMGNPHILLGLSLTIIWVIALISYIRLILIAINNIQTSRGREIRSYIFCVTLIFLVLSPIFFSESLWCLEAQIRHIELLPGHCWYN